MKCCIDIRIYDYSIGLQVWGEQVFLYVREVNVLFYIRATRWEEKAVLYQGKYCFYRVMDVVLSQRRKIKVQEFCIKKVVSLL